MFAAEPPQEPLPYGRWAEALADHFNAAAGRIETEEDLGEGGELVWFPDRSWNGRTYVPATCPTSNGFELFGYVSYAREHEGAQATDFAAVVDYTDETADTNPDWTARPLRPGDRPLARPGGPPRHGHARVGGGAVPNGAVATTELGPTTTDQCILADERFTLISLDAYTGDYVEVRLFGTRGVELAKESLYEDE